MSVKWEEKEREKRESGERESQMDKKRKEGMGEKGMDRIYVKREQLD